jgi:DNA (cytosine-5)-methyltransferase 1
MKAITFFAGAGGACCGLEQAGFEVIWGNEYYGPIADIWQANHPGAILNRSDFHDLLYRDIPKADLYWFSPPCPEFSRAKAGRTGGTAKEDISIALKMAVIIRGSRPPMVAIENVPDYANSKSFACLQRHFRAEGYNMAWAVLNAADYGVPQTRQRLILVARLDGVAALPSATHSQHYADQMPLFGPRVLPWIGWYEQIADLLPSLAPTKIGQPQAAQLRSAGISPRTHDFLIQLTGYRNPRGPAIKLPHQPCLTITASMAHDGKLNKNGHPSFRSPATIATGGQILKVDRRGLARWQGFPDSHQWGSVESLNCRAIGNAVPIQLATAVGRSLLGQSA